MWTVGRDGSSPGEVFAAGANDRFPQWSPVDGRLAFISDRAGAYALFRARDHLDADAAKIFEAVMAASTNLVRPTKRLTPLGVVKG